MRPILSSSCPASLPILGPLAKIVSLLEKNSFAVKNGRVLRSERTAKEELREEPIANFLAWICEDHVIRDVTSDRHSFKIEGWSLTQNKALPPVSIEAEELESGKWVAKRWGSAAFVYPKGKRFLAEMIITASPKIDSVQVMQRTGWVNLGSGWEFLHAGGSTGPTSVHVDLERSTGCPNLKHYQLPRIPLPLPDVAGTALDFLTLAQPRLSYPLFAAVMLAPLGELMRQNDTPIDFTPFLVGKSQSGKSSLASTCLSFFGTFDKAKFPANFTDTANSLEAKLEALPDVLGVCDDFFPSSPQQLKEMKSLLRKLVRATSDGNLRSRFGKKTGVARAFMLATGEVRPALTASDLNRIIFLDMERGDLNYSSAFLPLWRNRENLRHFMVHYLRWIACRWDRIKNRIGRIQSHLERTYASAESGRTMNALLKLAAGLDVALLFLRESGCIDQATARKHRQVAGTVFRSLYRSETELTPVLSPGEMFLTAISDLVQAKKVAITPLSATSTPAGWIGCQDDSRAYLVPTASFEAVKKHYARQGIPFAASAVAVWKDLAKREVFSYNPTRQRYTRQKKLPCRNNSPTDLLFIDRKEISGL